MRTRNVYYFDSLALGDNTKSTVTTVNLHTYMGQFFKVLQQPL